MLTVSVGNENEAGSVSVSGDPEAGATLTASVSDPDGAASGVGWVWSVGASPTGPFSVVSGATGAEFVVRAADVGKYLRAAATYTDSTHSASGQTASETVGPVGATNSAPRFADSNSDGTADAVTRTVTENTTTGDVGLAVTATDADSDALTYSVAESSGPDAAADPAADLADFNRDFSLDAATGQVRVRAGAAIDYESRSAYIVAYRVTDNKNAAGGNDPAVDDTLVLTIDVTDANEAPRFADSDSDGTADAVTRTVSENTTSGDVGLAVTAADPESGDVLAYSVAVTSEAGAAADLADFNRDFSLDAATGQVSVKATAAIDYETRAAYKVAYRVTDNKNSAGSVDTAVDDTLVLTIDVTDANEAPRFADSDSDGTADAVSRTVTENTASGSVGLAVTAADPDSGDVLAYSVAESSGPDAAADPAADLADFNRDFSLDAATGQVSVRAGAAIDYETRSTYIVAYRVTDNKNSAGSVDTAVDDTLVLTVSVGNENEAGSVSVSGDPEAGATLTASVSDPDGAASGVGWVWSVGASPTGPFSVVSGATGAEFVVRAADVGKYLRAAATYTDSTHSASGQTASETVGPVGATNSAPEFADSNSDGTADAVSRTVSENTTTGDVGLAVTATDADSDALTYSVAESSGPDAAADPAADLDAFNRDFSLDAATGQVSVRAGAAIDYEARSAYIVAYRVTDNKNAAGGNDPAVDDTLILTIDVTDVAETTNSAPGFASSSASRTVAENTASGNVGLAVTATDADSDALTYSVAESSGPDAAADPAADLDAFNRDFEFDPAAAGQVSVKAGAAIDYESRSAYIVAYRVTDNKNAAGGNDPAIDDTIMLTINVGNENEAGVVVVSGGLVPGVTLTASVSDPDGAVSGVSWQWARGDAERGLFVDVAGASDVSFVLSPADSGKFVRATASYVDVAHSVPGQMADETVGPVAAAGVVVAPSVPRGVRVASGLGAVTVSWGASQSNGGALLRFEYRSAKGSTIGHDVPWVDAGDALEVVVRGLETGAVSGELYTLEVRARNEAGYSDTVRVRGVRPLPRQHWRWVSFGQYQHSAEEGGDTATVRVRLQTRTNDRVEVPVVVSYHGGATSDDVHEVVRSVVFEPGERERTLRVRAVDDRDDDDGEWVGLGFGDLPAGLHAGGPNGSARVSIVDSVDDVPGVSAGFVQASMNAREGQRVTPTLTLSAAPEVPVFQTRPTSTVASWRVRLELSWTSSTAHGPGRFGGQASSWVQFDAGHMSRSIEVLCPDDQVRGPAHSITVEIDSAWLEGVPERLAAPIPLELASGNRRLVVDCAEDDTAAPPTTPSYPTVAAAISTTAQPAVMREAGETSATLAVTLSADPGRDVWIPLRVTADGADSSDFDFGDPYENGVLRYAPFRPSGGVHRFGDDHAFPYVLFRAGGPLTQTFRVWAQDDRHHDPGEAIDIALGNLPERITGTGSVRVSISDDDPAPAVTVSLRTYDSPPSEDAGPARVCVRLDKNPQRRLVIALEVTRNGGATPADHSAVPAEVVFEDYQHDPFPHSPRCANIELWALDDTERDPDESITITITTTPPDVTIDPTRRSITIELRDNDTD